MLAARERLDELLRRAGVASVSATQACVVLVLAVACLGWCAWRWWPRSAQQEFSSGPALESKAPVDPPAAEASASATSAIVVHVVGAVRRPGVYTLPKGSRVGDAIAAAGGALGSAAPEALNLARLLGDGEQVALPTLDQWKAGELPGAADRAVGADGSAEVGAATPGAGAVAIKVDLNSADQTALDALPGVGPATAQRIVEDREANGPFAKPEDLMRVSGIGPKKFDALKDLVTAR